MTKAGFYRTFDQCRVKVKKLRGEYRKVKDGNNKTGEDRKEWKYFEVVDDILGTRPSTKPEVLVDILEDEEEVIEDYVHEIEEDEESPGISDSVEALVSSWPTSSENSDCVIVEKQSVKKENTEGKKKGKKRSAKEERIENMMVMVTKVLEGQRESDKLFMDRETKRMKMEQTVLELEHQRYQEDRVQEERQRREERQFQIELYAMMCGNPPLTYGTLPFPHPASHGSPPPPMHQAFHFQPGFPGTSTHHSRSQSCLEFEDEQ